MPVSRKKNLSKLIQQYHELRERVMKEALAAGGIDDPDKIIAKALPQSRLFMMEIIPFMHRLWGHLPEGAWRSVLDVGPESMAGTALLASIHAANSFNRLKLDVHAIDINNKFETFKEVIAPNVTFHHGDIFGFEERKFDMVIASHVIEHVPDPVAFVRRLQELAKEYVVIACPWREDPLVTPGHVNTIDKDFTMQVGARDLTIYTNYSWGKMREVCMFWLPGKAR